MKVHPSKLKQKSSIEINKIKFIGKVDVTSSICLLGDNKFNQLFLFKDPILLCLCAQNVA